MIATALHVARTARPNYNGDLAQQLADMTDERDFLLRELGITRDREKDARVQSKLGLTGKQAALLMTLYERKGRVVSRDALMTAIYGGADEPEVKIIDVFMCKIRGRIGSGAIETVWGRGFQITEAGVAMVEQALKVVQ